MNIHPSPLLQATRRCNLTRDCAPTSEPAWTASSRSIKNIIYRPLTTPEIQLKDWPLILPTSCHQQLGNMAKEWTRLPVSGISHLRTDIGKLPRGLPLSALMRTHQPICGIASNSFQ